MISEKFQIMERKNNYLIAVGNVTKAMKIVKYRMQ